MSISERAKGVHLDEDELQLYAYRFRFEDQEDLCYVWEVWCIDRHGQKYVTGCTGHKDRPVHEVIGDGVRIITEDTGITKWVKCGCSRIK